MYNPLVRPRAETQFSTTRGESMLSFRKPYLISLLVAICLVACASKTSPISVPVQSTQVFQTAIPNPSAKPPLIPLKVGIQPFFAYGPFFIAQDRGYFAEQGLDVEFVTFNNTADSIPALLQGQLDVMSGLLTVNTLSAIAQGGNIKYVADRGYLDPAICSGNAFVARKGLLDSGELNDLSNLAGKKISTTKNTIAEYALDLLLQKAKLTQADIQFVTISQNQARLEALGSGAVDIVSFSEPWVTDTRTAGNGDSWQPFESILPNGQYGLVFYGPNLLTKNPDAGRRFMVAYLKGVRDYQEGKTASNIDILAKYTGETPAELKQICWQAFKVDGSINTQTLLDFQAWAIQKGYLTMPLTIKQLWDPEFIDNANTTLK
jgi:NitT/TauT family transport system substrate-binding protein